MLPLSVRKSVRCEDGLVLRYLITYDTAGRKKASVFESS